MACFQSIGLVVGISDRDEKLSIQYIAQQDQCSNSILHSLYFKNLCLQEHITETERRSKR